jgi:hypothetical protein
MINIRQNKAFALAFSLIFLFFIVSFMDVYILAVAGGVSTANRTANLKKAYYAADAGLADAYERITQAGLNTVASSTCVNSNIPSTCSVPFIPAATTDNGVYSVGSVNGSYIVSIVYSSTPRTNYIITSTGTYGNESKTLQLKIISATIARYAYWTNTEINPTIGTPPTPTPVWWITGMVTVGLVDTNGTFNIYGNPVFKGSVSEVGAAPNYYDNTSIPSSIWIGGLTNNASQITISPQTLTAIQTVANNGSGLVLTGASTIVFNPTGTVTVTGNVVNSNCTPTTRYNNTTISKPANGVIYVQSTSTIPQCNSHAQDGSATVQGTVSGQLTVATDQNIYISGNVAYNNDPRTNPSSTDMVGLVANQNVTVIEADAPAQLEIVGALMALQGSFNVDQYTYNPDPINRGSADGAMMDQFGSLINNYRGPIGTFNTTTGQLVSGWNEDQSYDTRLTALAPPGFPPLTNSAGYGVYTKLNILECSSGVCG